MKRLFTFLLFAALIAGPLMAQKGLRLGALLLPQAALLINDDDQSLDEDSYQLALAGGMAGGISADWHFAKFMGLQLNVLYSQQGGRFTTRRDINFRNNFNTRIEYLKIPVMLSINSSPANRKVMFGMNLGASFNFRTRAWEYNDDPSFESPIPSNFSNFPTETERFDNFVVSLVGDIGVDVRLTYDLMMTLRLRADYIIQDVEDKNVTFRVTEGGSTQDIKYWDWARGSTRNAETFGLAGGLLIGVSYLINPQD
ncbi:MAG: outer membrane beta-barrel protein [Bacteroidota bacterium]